MNNKKQIAVVIPTWRRVEQLVTLLDALRKQIRPPDEVIVACRWDDYESISAVKEWAEKIIKNPKKFDYFWKDPETKTVFFIGKDNIIFHLIIFPILLIL